MGTPGVPWDVPKVKIVEALKRNKGKLLQSAKDLDCCFMTIDKYIKKDPELVELLAQLRRGEGNWFVDEAEEIIKKALAHTEFKYALQTSFFILNTNDVAKERGWNRSYQPSDSSQGSTNALDQILSFEKALAAKEAALEAYRNALKAAGVPLPEGLDKSQSGVENQS